MPVESATLIKFVIAMLSIMDPPGAVPMFMAVTAGRSNAEKHRIALVTSLAVFVTLILAALAGKAMLSVFGITIDDLRIAGGLALLAIGFSMLNAQESPARHSPAEQAEGTVKQSPAIVPLAIPLISGPGAIATVIVFADSAPGWQGQLSIAACLLVVAVVVLITLRLAVPISGLMGQSGLNVMTRVMGLLLSSIAVGMIVAGLKGAFPVLAG